jgi:hypothetical protein
MKIDIITDMSIEIGIDGMKEKIEGIEIKEDKDKDLTLNKEENENKNKTFCKVMPFLLQVLCLIFLSKIS